MNKKKSIWIAQGFWFYKFQKTKPYHPAGTSVISALFEGFYNNGLWEKIFWSIRKLPKHSTQKWHCTIMQRGITLIWIRPVSRGLAVCSGESRISQTGGGAILLFIKTVAKTAWKWKKLDREGRPASLLPPGSANVFFFSKKGHPIFCGASVTTVLDVCPGFQRVDPFLAYFIACVQWIPQIPVAAA